MTLERRLLAVIALVVCLLAVNDMLPYVGARDDSCQTMFSGLEWTSRTNNHFFIPQRALVDLWEYRDLRAQRVDPAPPEGRLRVVADWLLAPDRRRSIEAIRVALDALCGGGHRVAFEARLDRGHEWRSHPDACRDPVLSRPHRWIPVRLFETDYPRGDAP